jgi:hypothetical protein|tara:strand:+ start:1820 stop:2212 length:393 start_codon:yes stop_codon:yes gene_type:complete
MAEIKSIFGEFENLHAANAENNLVLTCKEFIKESEKFVSDLIYEDDRYKNNQRWFSSKKIIQRGMSLSLMYELLIQTLIEDYKEKYGETSFIKKIEYFIKNLLVENKKNIKPYLYLIDINSCEKELIEYL